METLGLSSGQEIGSITWRYVRCGGRFEFCNESRRFTMISKGATALAHCTLEISLQRRVHAGESQAICVLGLDKSESRFCR